MEIKGKGNAEKVKGMVLEFISQLDIDEEVTFKLTSKKNIPEEVLKKENFQYVTKLKTLCTALHCASCPMIEVCDNFMLGTIDVAPEDLTSDDIEDMMENQGSAFLFSEKFGEVL